MITAARVGYESAAGRTSASIMNWAIHAMMLVSLGCGLIGWDGVRYLVVILSFAVRG